MPLTMVKTGEPNQIKKVGGKEETKRFLENLGFVAGGTVTVVSEIGGNMIVNVKDSRVAIGKDMANKIMAQKRSKYGNFKGCTVWKDGEGKKACRGRSGKKTYHGYGNHKRCGYIREKGGTIGRSGGGYGERL